MSHHQQQHEVVTIDATSNYITDATSVLIQSLPELLGIRGLIDIITKYYVTPGLVMSHQLDILRGEPVACYWNINLESKTPDSLTVMDSRRHPNVHVKVDNIVSALCCTDSYMKSYIMPALPPSGEDFILSAHVKELCKSNTTRDLDITNIGLMVTCNRFTIFVNEDDDDDEYTTHIARLVFICDKPCALNVILINGRHSSRITLNIEWLTYSQLAYITNYRHIKNKLDQMVPPLPITASVDNQFGVAWYERNFNSTTTQSFTGNNLSVIRWMAEITSPHVIIPDPSPLPLTQNNNNKKRKR